LPFADFSRGRNVRDVALVVAAGPADATNSDRVLLVIETRRETSRARLIAALDEIGTPFTYVAAHRTAPPECWHLVEFDGPFSALDALLASALRPFGEPAPAAWLLGSYARPLPLNAK
jgi:hypothetical protein